MCLHPTEKLREGNESMQHVDERTVRLTELASLAALDPEGRYLAVVHGHVARRWGHAACVTVLDARSGGVVTELPAAGVVYDLRWISPSLLVVAHDLRGLHACLSTHELPDGGVVGRRVVPGSTTNGGALETSADGARMLATFRGAGCHYQAPLLLSLPSLDLIANLRPFGASAHSHGLTITLHPDGRDVCGGLPLGDGVGLAVASATNLSACRVIAREKYQRHPVWAGAHRVAFLEVSWPEWRSEVVVIDTDLGVVLGRRQLPPEERPILLDTPSPDHSRALLLWESDNGDVPTRHVDLLRFDDLARVPLSAARTSGILRAASARWVLGGRAVVLASGPRTLDLFDHEGAPLARYVLRPPSSTARITTLNAHPMARRVCVGWEDGRHAVRRVFDVVDISTTSPLA